MQHRFITKQGSPTLTLFFTGWGMDTNPFLFDRKRAGDLCICYDYTSLELDHDIVSGYHDIQIIAWSMGVWAASAVAGINHLPVSASLAINGTPFPVDDKRGIPSGIFRGTINGLNEHSLQKFYRRMCGNLLSDFLGRKPLRDIESLATELTAIQKHYETTGHTGFTWQKAIIGYNDLIFPPANQQNAWQGISQVEQTNDFHYMNFEKYLYPDINSAL